jgi:non-ribosomal peptide synthase protein (TIGR01720 family)
MPAQEVRNEADLDQFAGERPIPLLANVARFLGERSTPNPGHWNLGVMLHRDEPIDPRLMEQVVAGLLTRHEALRLRFRHDATGWASSIAPATGPVPYTHFELANLSDADQTALVETRAEELQRSLDLAHGPLIRVASFDLGSNGHRLLVIVHHFAMDGLSWRPFWVDFNGLLGAVESGRSMELPPPTTPFAEWAHLLKARADGDAIRGDIRAWLNLPWAAVRPIPQDLPGDATDNTNQSAREIVLEFSLEETQVLFRETPGVPHKVDFLLTALAGVQADWTGSRTVLVDLMGHGRDEDIVEDVDLFGTVGFFISYTPMVLTLPRRGSELLTTQVQPILRRGLDFDLLRYMTSDATVRQSFTALPRAQVLFNHLGKRDELDTVPPGSKFSIAPESIGATHSPDGVRYYPLAIASQVWRDRLRLNFVYSENLHRRSTIERLAEAYRERLLALVAGSRRP